MKIGLINSLKEMQAIKNEWQELFLQTGSSNPFLSWEWNYLWISEFCDEEDIEILAVRKSEKLIAVLPLKIENSTLLFLSDNLFADYMDILALDKNEVFPSIIDFLKRNYTFKKLVFETIPETSPNLENFEKFLDQKFLHTDIHILSQNPYIQTFGDFDLFLQGISRGVRKEFNRTRNSLEEADKDWKMIKAQSDLEKDYFIDELVRFHLQRQEHKIGNSIFNNKKNINFFKRLSKLKEVPWDMDLKAIKVKDQIVSVSISIILNNIYFYWIPSFDLTFGRGSIGNYHIRALVEQCFDSDIIKFDFMGGGEDYKFKWTKDFYNNYRLSSYNNHFIRYKDLAYVRIRPLIKKTKDNSRILSMFWKNLSKILDK